MSAGLPRSCTDNGWLTYRVRVPVDEIAYVAAILEGHENEYLVRTETRGLGILRIWLPESQRHYLEQLFIEMRQEFDVEILGASVGMEGLDEVYPE